MMEKHIFHCILLFVPLASMGTQLTEGNTTEAFVNGGVQNPGGIAENTSKKNATETIKTTTTTMQPDINVLGTGEKSQDHIAEFEDALSSENLQNRYMMFRSAASNGRAFHVKAEDHDRTFKATLCVQGSGDNKVKIQVISLVYSNDGPSDNISLQVDGKNIGTAKTDEVYNGGYEWNVFKDCGPIGEAVTLDNGNHTLSMEVKSDQWGAEFDTITLRVHNQDPGADIICRTEIV